MATLLLTHDLCLANTPGAPPSFQKEHRVGWPDLTIVSPNYQDKITNWVVSDNASLSDHKYITYTIHIAPELKMIRRFNTKHGKISKFKQQIAVALTPTIKTINELGTVEQLDDVTTNIQEVIKTTASKCFRMRTLGRQPRFKWWNQALRTHRNLLNALYKRKTRTQQEDPSNYSKAKEIYNRERARYRKHLATQKSNAWKAFCTQYNKTYGITFKVANEKTFTPPDTLVDWGTGFVGQTAAYKNMLQSHFPFYLDSDRIGTDEAINNLPDTGSNTIKRHEIKHSLDTLNANKAPGVDSIDLRLWRLVFQSIPKLLISYINKCNNLSHFPTPLKKGEVVFFNKKGKDPNLATSYRPVCLLPALGKIIEKVIHRRLIYHLDSLSILSPLQYGFRTGRSCEQALHTLNTHLQEVRASKHYSAVISTDIQSAFDQVIWSRLLNNLIKHGVQKALIKIIASYLNNRTATTQGDMSKYDHVITRGCPQGSVLGPLCWLLIAEELLSAIELTPEYQVVAYADDFLFIFSGTNWRTIATQQQEKMKTFEQWLKNNKLQLSNNKTTATLILKRDYKQPKRKPTFKLNDKKITITQHFKFLGLTHSYTLNWHQHINELTTKVIGMGTRLGRVTANSWGVPSATLTIWYRTVVEKVITYAAGIWAMDLSNHLQMKILSLQRPYLLRITRAYRTAPTAALCTLANLTPLHLTLQREAIIQRGTRLQQQITIGELSITPSEIDQKHNLLTIHPSKYHIPRIGIQPIEPDKYASDVIHIYTDGSKMDSGVGAAYAVYKNMKLTHNWSAKLPNYATVFQAELTAIAQAIHLTNNKKHEQYVISTDSQSSIQAIANTNQRNKYVQNIQLTLIGNKHITLNWIKGHSGQTGNELADSLAKQATFKDTVDLNEIREPLAHVKHRIDKHIANKWQQFWSNHKTGRHTYNQIPQAYIKTPVYTPGQTAALTNHGPYPEYLHRFNKRESPLCVCGEQGNADHYLSHCPLTQKWHIKPRTPNNKQHWAQQLLHNKTVIAKANIIHNWLTCNSDEITPVC